MDDINTIDDLFEAASNFVRLNVNNISKDSLLYLYARFKQATEGVCDTIRPTGLFNFEAKSKYDAWKALKGMSKETAMNEYVEHLDSLFADWRTKKNVDKVGSMSNAGTFGLKLSTMSSYGIVDEFLNDNQKTLFDWCKEGNLAQIKEVFDKVQEDTLKEKLLNQVDDHKMTLLMWACDRGMFDIVKFFLKYDYLNINAQDQDGQTCLHYAATCEHLDIIKELLEKNVDVNLVDNEGTKASELTSNKKIIDLLSH
jgi:acyl-CoA-binding protein